MCGRIAQHRVSPPPNLPPSRGRALTVKESIFKYLFCYLKNENFLDNYLFFKIAIPTSLGFVL